MRTASRRVRVSCVVGRLAAVVAGGMALTLAATMAGSSAAGASGPSRWTSPVNLSSSGGSEPDLVVSGDGTTAVAVWLRKKDGHRVVQSRTARIIDGVPLWSHKQDLSVTGRTSDFSPAVALSHDGDTAVVLWAGRSLDVRARSAHIRNGIATWSPRQTVAGSGNGRIFFTDVGMSRDGSTVVAIWSRQGDYTGVVQTNSARIRGGTASWKTTQDLAPSVTQSEPQLGVSRDGATAVAVWSGASGNVQSSTARILRGVATWMTVQNLSPAGWSRAPQVALSADGGTAIAVWAQSDPAITVPVVEARTAVINGASADWGDDPAVLSGTFGAGSPHVAISRHGTTAVATWIATWSPDVGITQARAARIEAGSTSWSGLQDLSAPTGATSAGADVALSADGTTAVAVWSFGSVQSRRASVTAGTATWKRPRSVSAVGAYPLVGLSGDGATVVCVWNRFDGTGKLATYLQSASAYAPQ